jgi:hypothetical protein
MMEAEAQTAMVRIRSSQRFFTEEEVSRLTGICRDHLRNLVESRHLGLLVRVARSSAGQTRRLFTPADLFVLTMLAPRCEHSV